MTGMVHTEFQKTRSGRILHFVDGSRTLCGLQTGIGSGIVRDGNYSNNVPCRSCCERMNISELVEETRP